jgi:hypothetical protein
MKGAAVTRRGRIRHNTVVFDQPPGFEDGAEVEVVVRPVEAASGCSKHPLLRAAGRLAQADEWDAILARIYEERRRPGRPEPKL